MKTPTLYHWSPTERRSGIVRQGLMPGKRPVTSIPGWRAPYVCLAENPLWAWNLSGDGQTEIPSWDLWQVHLSDGHTIKRIKHWPNVNYPHSRWQEWRVFDRIYKRGVIYVGTRVC